MNSRLELQRLLESFMDDPHVYYQAPTKIEYPAILFERSGIPKANADNIPYKIDHEYKITVIDKRPDSDILEKLMTLPRCRFASHYIAENLNHDVFYLCY